MQRRDVNWWKKSVVYQIYPKSFMDSNGDGHGDLKGVIQKLDYLAFLGVDFIWLTPIYESPQKDNGYDVSDYYRIDPRYGTMDDFEQLVKEAQRRNIKIMMDIVVNHTSIEHEWFKQSRKSKDNPYRHYYIWKSKKDGREPNNWESKFGGSAWKWDAQTEEYYLHLFDQSQADINWENEEIKKKIFSMMNFWRCKGVSGFRLDVINLISKDQNFPDDLNGVGKRYYTDGPRIHELLQEMHQEVFSKSQTLTVGEMSSTTIENCIKYTNPNQKELDMVFNFHHLKVDYPNREKKWEIAHMDLVELKEIFEQWQVSMYENEGWNALFWCNHDQPRIVSRFGNDQEYLSPSAKMLATTIHMMQGTPFIYQGEEIGMTDPKFSDIREYRDVETLNIYRLMKKQGMAEKDIMEIIQKRSRDNSRTPMQWNSSENSGFTTGSPWIQLSLNYEKINVENAINNPDSIFYYYKKLIELRKELDILTYGDFELLEKEHPHVFAYIRNYREEKLVVINHFSENELDFQLPFDVKIDQKLIANYADTNINDNILKLRPYESIVFYLKEVE